MMTTMPPLVRKLALAVHLTVSVGWIGAAAAYLALAVAAASSQDARTVRAAWVAMDLIGWSVLVPLAAGTLFTGLVMALGTSWGVFRHYWVVLSLALTLLASTVLFLHMPDVTVLAAQAQTIDAGGLEELGSDLVHAGGGIVVLLVILVLNVYKPQGLTRYGWRRQRDQADRRSRHRLPAAPR